MLQEEFETLIADTTKRVVGTIAWEVAKDNPSAKTFRVVVDVSGRYPLFVQGRYNPQGQKLSYPLVSKQKDVGRIYGLDFGQTHINPDLSVVGDPHKNYWTEGDGDRWAYEPRDISATWNDPIRAWTEFCVEANILFFDIMLPP